MALQIGHRISNDLDLFCSQAPATIPLCAQLRDTGFTVSMVNRSQNHEEFLVEGNKVDLIQADIPLRFPARALPGDLENIKVADPRDIGLMKLFAIGSRGSKKDFVDLYCLTRKEISLESLLMLAFEEGKNMRYSKLLFLKGLVDFDQAEQENNPAMIWKVDWNEVKAGVEKEVKMIAEKLTSACMME